VRLFADAHEGEKLRLYYFWEFQKILKIYRIIVSAFNEEFNFLRHHSHVDFTADIRVRRIWFIDKRGNWRRVCSDCIFLTADLKLKIISAI
jgi:hypothetical protein